MSELTFRELLAYARLTKQMSADGLAAAFKQAYYAGLGQACALIDRERLRRRLEPVRVLAWLSKDVD